MARSGVVSLPGADAPAMLARLRLRHAGFSFVDARMVARCTVRVPLLIRLSPPPMCIKHDESPALQTSAPVDSTLPILSASIADEVSEFFSANVPPNPQHTSPAGSSTRSRPCTDRNRDNGLSP